MISFFFLREAWVYVDDGLWHHICVQWRSLYGELWVYEEGLEIDYQRPFQIGHVIPEDGVLIVGQEQDSFGGNFDANQNYIGELTDLNIWRYLHAFHARQYTKSCHVGKGNVLKWSDFKGKIKGVVKYVSPSNCEVNK